jgi:hypothetical protein
MEVSWWFGFKGRGFLGLRCAVLADRVAHRMANRLVTRMDLGLKGPGRSDERQCAAHAVEREWPPKP